MLPFLKESLLKGCLKFDFYPSELKRIETVKKNK